MYWVVTFLKIIFLRIFFSNICRGVRKVAFFILNVSSHKKLEISQNDMLFHTKLVMWVLTFNIKKHIWYVYIKQLILNKTQMFWKENCCRNSYYVIHMCYIVGYATTKYTKRRLAILTLTCKAKSWWRLTVCRCF